MSDSYGCRPEEDRSLPWDRPVTRRDLLRYGGLLGFGAVGATMLASCTPIADEVPSPAPDTIAHPQAQAKYLAIVVIDGCRADYLQNPSKYGSMPTFQAMAAHGTQYTNAWTGMLESITPACHASLGSGRFPKNNGGIMGFYWENPSDDQWVSSVNLTNNLSAGTPGGSYAIDPTSLEDILRQAKTPTMASLLKEADPRAKIYAGAGVKFYAVDAAGGPDADYITYFWNNGPYEYRPLSIPGHELPANLLNDPKLKAWDYVKHHTTIDYAQPGLEDSLTVDLAVNVLRQERPRIVILNLGEMDYPFGHETGGPLIPHYVKDIMTNADASINRLQNAYRELGIFDETVFCVLGDHGMVPLRQQFDKSLIPDVVSKGGTSLFHADSHTSGFVWIDDPTRAGQVAEAFDKAKLPTITAVYFRGEVGGRPAFLPSPETASTVDPRVDKAYRYLLETVNGSTSPHVVLMYQELTGTLENHGTRHGHANYWLADHGGASWQSHHVPMIMQGPGIKAGMRSPFPARIVDLAPTFLRLMGAPFPMMDGIVLSDALTQPTSSERRSQSFVGHTLSPVVAALKRQSQIDMASVNAAGDRGKLVNPPPQKTSHGYEGIGVY